MPLEKQNGWDEFKANLAASWAIELLFLRTQQKVQNEKKKRQATNITVESVQNPVRGLIRMVQHVEAHFCISLKND